jgi:molybdenum cofactor cytidylyltransferase
MKLYEAFDVMRGDVVAFIGAGGKTSALVNMGYELAELGWRVTATTTTRISLDQLALVPYALRVQEGTDTLSEALRRHRFVFLYDRITGDDVYGVTPDYVSHLLDNVDSDVLLIEADSARGLPLKAPYPYEPVIPAESSLVVPIASVSVLGQELNEDYVYNAQAIMDRYGFVEHTRVKSPWVAQVLRDEKLGLQGVPENARVIALLNQVTPHGYARARARLIARLTLLSPRVSGVAIGSVRGADPVYEVQRSVGAVVLAAGMSKRMGQPKVLLPWTARRTIIEQIIEQLMLARLDHICVVTGSRSGEVRQLATGMGAETAYNPDYRSGEMLSSLKVGLAAMPRQVQAALVVLGDQPRIQPRVITQVLTAYAEGRGKIVAPSFQKRRGHPILIDRRYWQEILSLPPDGAPRDVINAHAGEIAYVDVDTDSVLRDVDTPDDYAQERWRAGLSD